MKFIYLVFFQICMCFLFAAMTNMCLIIFTFIIDRNKSCTFVHSKNIFYYFIYILTKNLCIFLCISHKYLSLVFFFTKFTNNKYFSHIVLCIND